MPHVHHDTNLALLRLALSLATGVGKTSVMAMNGQSVQLRLFFAGDCVYNACSVVRPASSRQI
jgi:hypothetical protein